MRTKQDQERHSATCFAHN